MTPFSTDDLYLHRKVTGLHCVPAQASVLASVRSVDRAGNAYISHIWEFADDGRTARQVTQGPGKHTEPRWSPDGKRFAFLSDRGGSMQVHVMEERGEAMQVGDFPQGASAFRWMPDSRNLLVTAAQTVDPDLQGARGKPAPERAKDAPEVAWRLPYKFDGVGYILAREIHLHLLPLDGSPAAQLTDGPFDVMGFEASPNGKHIAYSRTREGRFAHCTDLWVCDTAGGHHRRLTNGHATVLQPAWSPGGRWIAFGGAIKEGDGESRLWLLDFASGTVRPMGPRDMELALPDAMHWCADGESLLAVRAHRGRHEAVRIRVGEEDAQVVARGDRQFGAFTACDDMLYFAADTPVAPCDVFAHRVASGAERRLSDLNPWWRERTPLEMQCKTFDVPDGQGGTERIEGWLLHAKDASGPMPLLNDVHGGPAAYALLDYDTNVFWQALCSRGWAVLMLNAVGSSSFGSEFCCRLSGHWGEMDLPQHLAAVSQLRAQGVCDGRVAIAGKSYGGFFTGWAIGHCDIFRAAIVMAPVGNIETHYGTSDGGYYADPLYIDTLPRFDRVRARELSPLQSIEQARTPTLFMQGKEDERCPKCQSEELFVSFARASETPAELVLYPGEDHHFLGEGNPGCRADAAGRIVRWVATHTAAHGPHVAYRTSNQATNHP